VFHINDEAATGGAVLQIDAAELRIAGATKINLAISSSSIIPRIIACRPRLNQKAYLLAIPGLLQFFALLELPS
jgi:hypothetical protein